MDQKAIVEKIVEIESRYDVNSIIYEDIKVWPLIRHLIVVTMSYPLESHQKKPSALSQYGALLSLYDYYNKRKYLGRVKSEVESLKKADLSMADEENRKQLERLSSLGPKEILLFTRQNDYLDVINGDYYNKHIDPMVELVKDKYSYLKLELSSPEGEDKLPRFVETEFIKPFYDLKKRGLYERQPVFSRVATIKGFKGIKELVEEVTETIVLDEIHILNLLKDIWVYREIFTEILKVVRPKVVFLTCCYYNAAWGFISACRRLGIPSVDIQHGKQGKYHVYFTHWTKIPPDGYKIMPDYFWVWGKESQENINKWHPEGSSRHRAIIGGNRRLASCLDGADSKSSMEADEFYAGLREYEKVILFSAQPIENPIQGFVLDAMRSAPKSWLWLIRLHPEQVNDMSKIMDIFSKEGIENIEIECATKFPLFGLLAHIDHHLTCWSTVCYEALVFNVRTTIIHDTGLQFYRDYIKRGIFGYAADSETLINALKKEYTAEDLYEPNPYIETDISVANEALHSILESAKQAIKSMED
jgi:hypothetical protein